MYQPRMSNENIRRIYQLKKDMKKPMTHVLDEILNDYFDSRQKEGKTEGGKKTSKEAILSRSQKA
jgi:hypothetical protein